MSQSASELVYPSIGDILHVSDGLLATKYLAGTHIQSLICSEPGLTPPSGSLGPLPLGPYHNLGRRDQNHVEGQETRCNQRSFHLHSVWNGDIVDLRRLWSARMQCIFQIF